MPVCPRGTPPPPNAVVTAWTVASAMSCRPPTKTTVSKPQTIMWHAAAMAPITSSVPFYAHYWVRR